MNPTTPTSPWHGARRVLFRFMFAYLLLYGLVVIFIGFAGNVIRFAMTGTPGVLHVTPWTAIPIWVGQHLFGLQITVLQTGSGDTTYNYVEVFCFLVLAAIAAAVWTVLDRQRRDYPRLHEWLRVYVRFALASTMISYGAAKVFPNQFPATGLTELTRALGDFSPMRLLWTFMGASTAYTMFTGASEMIGGLLLTVRRTTLLGALVCAGVLANVVMLNVSYDVSVKLFSCHLLVMAVYLIGPDVRRLANVFLLNRAVPPAPPRSMFARTSPERTARGVGTVLIVGWVIFMLILEYGVYRDWVRPARLPVDTPLYGIWQIEDPSIDGPESVADSARWRRLIFDRPGSVVIQRMSNREDRLDLRRRYRLELNADERTLVLSRRNEPDFEAFLSYRRVGPERIALGGTFGGSRIEAELRRLDEREFRLKRGFRWVSE